MAAGLNPTQDAEVTYLTDVTDSGTIAQTAFWTWNNDTPATYGPEDYETKWGQPTAGTGGTITYAFAAASNFTATEEKAFVETMDLWSDYANVSFQPASSQATAEVVIDRASDGGADGGVTKFYQSNIGSSTLGTPISGGISIDTSVPGFGPLGASFSDYGGYPWTTLIHEEGHVLGLGHGGPYDEGVTTTTPQYTQYDSLAFSVMSYVQQDDPAVEGASSTPRGGYQWGVSEGNDGNYYDNSPTTPMMLDIAAVQRLYGAAVNGPLSGGQTFGFNCNVVGDTEVFFDFTQNTKPIETLWDAGRGNTLDLSGFTAPSIVDLHAGDFSSCAGLTNNLAIAYGTAIDEAVTGAGADTLTANDDGDTLMGGAGSDSLTGGAGADLLFGGSGADTLFGGAGSDTIYGGKDDDVISGGAGFNLLSGDFGNDSITGGQDADTLYGGDGVDTLIGGAGHEVIYGNQGDDIITVTASAASTVFGGQGNDSITAAGDPNAMFFSGDLGNDTITGGGGADTLYAGGGDDVIHVGTGASQVYGNAGNDTILVSGAGASTIYGGQDNDTITVTSSTGQVLEGDLGDDTITGGGGADTIYGGAGADVLTGGAGANRFVYTALTDSAPSAPDRILDFDTSKDHIDISAIDAQMVAAGQAAFHWVSAFDGHAAEAELVYDASTNRTALELDSNGDGAADFSVLINGHVSQGGWLVF